MIKAIVFDLWNTLIPTTIDFVHLSALAKHEHLSLPEFIGRYEQATHLKKYRNFQQLRDDFFNAFKQFDNQLLEQELYEVYFNRFDKVYLFSDVDKTLTKLKAEGYKLALLSNTESLNMGKMIRRLGLDNYFDVLAFSYEVKAIKPDPKAFTAALKMLKVKPNEALMVGDSPRSDIAGAKAVGMHSCLINRKGKVFDVADFKADFEIKSLDEVFRVLGTINAQSQGRGVAKKKKGSARPAPAPGSRKP